jgi:hypothetical protein
MNRPGEFYAAGAEVLLFELHGHEAIAHAEHLVRHEGSPIAPARHRLTTLRALPIGFHLRRAFFIAHESGAKTETPSRRLTGGLSPK